MTLPPTPLTSIKPDVPAPLAVTLTLSLEEAALIRFALRYANSNRDDVDETFADLAVPSPLAAWPEPLVEALERKLSAGD